MKALLGKTLPENDNKRKWIAVGITVLIAGLMALLSIYQYHEYGIALFVMIPLCIGVLSTLLYGYNKQLTRKQAWRIALLSLGIFSAGLLVFAIEGAICIVMAAPIALLLTWIGSVLGYFILSRRRDKAGLYTLLFIGLIPATAFIERNTEPTLHAVVTAIDINASPQEVWKNVVAFPQLEEPTEFIFKTGIAYPINATIEGTGVGAIRHCNFTTGSFVEPITEWNENLLLKFDVAEQPAPMKELSFWDIDAPHLHDYFVSKRGQFKLTALANGHTRLEGTTWYYHDIRPAFYWRFWSNHIIHKIHDRVLEHIKVNAENQIASK